MTAKRLIENEKKELINKGLYKYQIKTFHFYLRYLLKLLSISCTIYEKDLIRYVASNNSKIMVHRIVSKLLHAIFYLLYRKYHVWKNK